MSKKKANSVEGSTAIDELLKRGTTTLTAGSRDDIYAMSTQLAGLIPEDVKWTRTAVEHTGGSFTQTFTIINND